MHRLRFYRGRTETGNRHPRLEPYGRVQFLSHRLWMRGVWLMDWMDELQRRNNEGWEGWRKARRAVLARADEKCELCYDTRKRIEATKEKLQGGPMGAWQADLIKRPSLSEDDYEVRCERCGVPIAYAPEEVWSEAPSELYCFGCWSDEVD
ncbi:hypothetical protein SEA_DMPSTRDIVER_192 [Mycobacterium phage DmpstrDiver]|nr:hypothetical protein SEA_DMPSTRDIVER_192 [Mycobacterium phage DmpstrDiver]